ncbi:MAG: (2Fe-2S)-binding protein, partial [Clostridia bacterium]|nr:(2Fe-2S)-binding protein [Clostridia bacterium]
NDDALLAAAKTLTCEPKYLRANYQILSARRILKDVSIRPEKLCRLKVYCFDKEYSFTAPSGCKLIDVLESSDIAIESRCRHGACGWCRCRLLKGSVAVYDNDKLRAADKMVGYIHACGAVLIGDVELAIDY